MMDMGRVDVPATWIAFVSIFPRHRADSCFDEPAQSLITAVFAIGSFGPTKND